MSGVITRTAALLCEGRGTSTESRDAIARIAARHGVRIVHHWNWRIFPNISLPPVGLALAIVERMGPLPLDALIHSAESCGVPVVHVVPSDLAALHVSLEKAGFPLLRNSPQSSNNDSAQESKMSDAKNDAAKNDTLTTQDVAARIGCGDDSILRWIRRRPELRPRKVKGTGVVGWRCEWTEAEFAVWRVKFEAIRGAAFTTPDAARALNLASLARARAARWPAKGVVTKTNRPVKTNGPVPANNLPRVSTAHGAPLNSAPAINVAKWIGISESTLYGMLKRFPALLEGVTVLGSKGRGTRRYWPLATLPAWRKRFDSVHAEWIAGAVKPRSRDPRARNGRNDQNGRNDVSPVKAPKTGLDDLTTAVRLLREQMVTDGVISVELREDGVNAVRRRIVIVDESTILTM
jgi:predicted DNA-binding transcriptional regulator AlpA